MHCDTQDGPGWGDAQDHPGLRNAQDLSVKKSNISSRKIRKKRRAGIGAAAGVKDMDL